MMVERTPAEKIDAGKTMGEMWDGFALTVLPFAPPGSVQHEEMKKAFFAGGLCLFNWFMVQLDEGTDPTDADMNRVSLMQSELQGFLSGEKPQ